MFKNYIQYLVSGLAALGVISSAICSADTLNVMRYGAKADGVTDDTQAFMKAMDKAAKKQGSTVYAPLGIYLISGTITVPLGVTLKGDYPGQGRQREQFFWLQGIKAKVMAMDVLF